MEPGPKALRNFPRGSDARRPGTSAPLALPRHLSRCVHASARELRRRQEQRHDDAEWLVVMLDRKSFAGDQLVIALGVTVTGEKRILGLVQTANENKRRAHDVLGLVDPDEPPR